LSRIPKTIFILSAGFVLGWVLIKGLGGATLPLSLALLLAYCLFPLIQRLEARGVQRQIAVIGSFALIFLLSFGAIVLLIPVVVRELVLFFHELPQSSAGALAKVHELAEQFGFDLDLSRDGVLQFVADHAKDVSGEIVKSTSILLKNTFSSFVGIVLAILNLFLVPLFFFYLLDHYEEMMAELKDLIPFSWRPKFREYAGITTTVFSAYIRGQTLVAICLAGLYMTGFSLIGLKFGLLIGLATGLLSIIPYVGSILGFITAMVISLANFNWPTTLGVIGVFIVVQGLEGFVLTPRLVGKSVGLGALATILALIIGGNLFGIVGMVLAIPVAAVLKFILKDLRSEYKKLPLFK
jgi:predicted PurR-regulated permease PerM